MGEVTGFLKYGRETPTRRPVPVRIRDWKEVYEPFPTEHLQTHKKDYASRRGLLMMVSRRRRLLDYLKKVSPQRYLDVIRRLDIRK